MFRSIPFATALCVFASASLAAEIHVPQQYSSIQAAINASCDGDEIIVDDGTYHEAISLLGKAVTLRSAHGPNITGIDATGRDSSVILCDSGETAETVIDGFTITGGVGTLRAGVRHGGGLYADLSHPTVRNCVFVGNTAGAGGGISLDFAWAIIANCVFENNEATVGGDYGGGGIYSLCASPSITNCLFTGNATYGAASGGGMALRAGHPEITNCSFFNNEGRFGGAVTNYGGEPVLVNCTFAQNQAEYPSSGGGMFCSGSGAKAAVIDCIFWDNTDGAGGPQIVQYYQADTTVLFSNVQGGWGGTGADSGTNIDADPLFVDPDGGDLHLLPGSPCIDKGDSMAFLETGLDCDLEGNPRPVAGSQGNYLGPFLRRVRVNLIADVDMGAYEFQP